MKKLFMFLSFLFSMTITASNTSDLQNLISSKFSKLSDGDYVDLNYYNFEGKNFLVLKITKKEGKLTLFSNFSKDNKGDLSTMLENELNSLSNNIDNKLVSNF